MSDTNQNAETAHGTGQVNMSTMLPLDWLFMATACIFVPLCQHLFIQLRRPGAL